MSYCLYLRKSRADAEAEARGEGETLARHERALIELAKRLKLNITQIYREVVSGETIAARPVMQQLLSEVEGGLWDGVLVMEVERLARGDTVDQGIMAQTFKYSGTKIITPSKTYDPLNEFDEEYFEFGLFMSRREYKTINRRLQRGRLASAKEGKYIGNKPPYGYKRVKLEKEKGWTLEPVPEEADVVRMIYSLYTAGEITEAGEKRRLGVALIVRRLNNLKIPTRYGGAWVPATVRDILGNPAYIGKIRWNGRPAVKKMVDGHVTVSRPRAKAQDCIIADGLHPAIIDKQMWEDAQAQLATNPPRPIGEHLTVKNPLSGIVVCGMCGRRMIRRPFSAHQAEDVIMCPVTSCKNVSAKLSSVEARMLKSLADWLVAYKIDISNGGNGESDATTEVKAKALKRLNAEVKALSQQKDKIYNLLEQGVYTTEVFLDRSRILAERIEDATLQRNKLAHEVADAQAREASRASIVPKVEKLLATYDTLETAQQKNDMLKEVLDSVTYTKTVGGRWHTSPDNFELHIYPKLPPAEPRIK